MEEDERTLIIAGRFEDREQGRYEIALTLDPAMLEVTGGIFAYEAVNGTIETSSGLQDFPEGRNSTSRVEAIDLTPVGQPVDQFLFQAGFTEPDGTFFSLQLTVAGPEFVSADGIAETVSAADLLSLDNTQLVFSSGAFEAPRLGFVDRFEFGERAGLGGFGEGLSVEEAQVVALLYEVGLDRDGEIDGAGLNFWIDSRERGTTELQMAQAFLISEEFEQSYGAQDRLSDQALVARFYVNALNRAGDDAGIAFWTETLESGQLSRAGLLRAFAVSQENAENLAFVQDLLEVSPGVWDFV